MSINFQEFLQDNQEILDNLVLKSFKRDIGIMMPNAYKVLSIKISTSRDSKNTDQWDEKHMQTLVGRNMRARARTPTTRKKLV